MSFTAYTRIKIIASPEQIVRLDNVFQHYPVENNKNKVYYFCRIERGVPSQVQKLL